MSNTLPAIAPPSACPAIDKEALALLAKCNPDTRTTNFLPPAVSQKLQTQLTDALEATTPAPLARQLAQKLMVCYPARYGDSADDLQGYGAILISEIRRFPQWAAEAALPKVWRSREYRPSIAVIVAALEAELRECRAALQRLQSMERDRERLHQEGKRRDDSTKRYLAEKAAQARFIEELEARVVERFGENAPAPGQYARVIFIIQNRGGQFVEKWKADVERLDPKAVALWKEIADLPRLSK